jgi:GNAT superfamily N-acetyltransferase
VTQLARPRPIASDDDVSEFDCGEPTLDQWIRNRALKNDQAGASRTFVSIDRDLGAVAGYYCMSASSLTREDATSTLRRDIPDPIPVILVGRLAVDRRYAGGGLGASLLQDAILKGIVAAQTVGARAFPVHALSDAAENFYRRFGFQLVPDSTRAMYLLLQDAAQTVTDVAGGK